MESRQYKKSRIEVFVCACVCTIQVSQSFVIFTVPTIEESTKGFDEMKKKSSVSFACHAQL